MEGGLAALLCNAKVYNRLSKNGKNGRLCIKITKALSLVSNQKMELCLFMARARGGR